MDINRENLAALKRTYTTAFNGGMEQGSPLWTQVLPFVSVFPSTSASNFYAWLAQIPGFREWVGERVWNNVASRVFEVVNREYEDGVVMPRKDMEDDQYGVYAPLIAMLAQAWLQLKRSVAVDVVKLNATCWDGKAFFAADHAYGSNGVNNLTTSALSTSTFDAAFLAAAGWKGAGDIPLNATFTHLVTGEALRTTAFNLVRNTKVEVGAAGAATDNPRQGRVEHLLWPELSGTYANYWFLFDLSKPLKPLLFQARKEAAPIMSTNPEIVEESGLIKFMASGRCAAAPSAFHLAYGGLVAA